MNILLVSPEATPFAKSGGLADVAGSLPRALRRLGHDVRLALPYYRCVARSGIDTEPGGVRMTVAVDGRPVEGNLRTCSYEGLPVYFIDNPELFDRDELYGYGGAAGDYPDNARRFGFFCRSVLHLIRSLDWQPDVLHLNDWQTGLIPVLLKTELASEPFYRNMASLLTIHNLGYQGTFPPAALKTLGLPPSLFTIDALEYYGQVSLLKGGVLYADRLTTVSETYCREIQTQQMGHGFEGILRQRRNDLFGVLNGLDTDLWDPARDSALDHPYTAKDLTSKGRNKAALQRELGLDVAPDVPLIAVVSRLDRQKGMDLILASWSRLMKRPIQFVLLGTGDKSLMEAFSRHAAPHSGRVAITLTFDEPLSRRIYAGSDLLLVPSRYEPCGLTQLIALRYGSLPVVRKTGGLADTVVDVDENPEKGNGFLFEDLHGDALLGALDRALALCGNRSRWQTVMRRGMTADHSWDSSARKYEHLYETIRERRDDRRERG